MAEVTVSTLWDVGTKMVALDLPKYLCPALCLRCPLAAPVIATVAVMAGGTLSALVLLRRTGRLGYDRVNHELLARAAVSREAGSARLARADLLLLAFRAVSFLFCATVMIRGIAMDAWYMAAFTIWNYSTLVLLQALLLAHSVAAVCGERYHVPRGLSCVTWTLFQIEVPNAILLDVVFWALLWDWNAGEAPEFQNLNVHGTNAVFMLIELWHNRVVFVPGQATWVAVYALVYCVVSWVRYADGALMPYPFLNVGGVAAPAWYVGLALVFVLGFFLCLLLARLKERWMMQHLRNAASLNPSSGYQKLDA